MALQTITWQEQICWCVTHRPIKSFGQLIANIHAYKFSIDCLTFLYSYLKKGDGVALPIKIKNIPKSCLLTNLYIKYCYKNFSCHVLLPPSFHFKISEEQLQITSNNLNVFKTTLKNNSSSLKCLKWSFEVFVNVVTCSFN